jgi:hypothetical protein
MLKFLLIGFLILAGVGLFFSAAFYLFEEFPIITPLFIIGAIYLYIQWEKSRGAN